jgi:hypothetical protein
MNWVREALGKHFESVSPETVGWVEAGELRALAGKGNKLCGCGGVLIALPSKSAGGRWAIVAPRRPSVWMRNLLKAPR